MGFKSGITDANIIIGASSHNPTIASLEWLKEKKIITENPENFNHSPALSYIITKNFQLLVEPDQLKLSVRVVNESNINELPVRLKYYINSLPETPYESVTINFKWVLYSDGELAGYELISKKMIKQDQSLLREIGIEGGISYLGVVVYQISGSDNSGSSLNIEPLLTSTKDILLNFSYQFKVSNDKKYNVVTDALDNFSKIFEDATQKVENINRFVSR